MRFSLLQDMVPLANISYNWKKVAFSVLYLRYNEKKRSKQTTYSKMLNVTMKMLHTSSMKLIIAGNCIEKSHGNDKKSL